MGGRCNRVSGREPPLLVGRRTVSQWLMSGRRIRRGCQRHCEAQLLTEDEHIDVGSMRENVVVDLCCGP